jgi:hypothetical protein
MPTPFVSLPENAKVIDVDLVVPPLVTALLLPSVAEFIEVVGGVVSTVQVNDAGDASLFLELSTDNTLNVWMLSFNKLRNVNGLVQVTNFELSILHSKWFIPTPLSLSPPVSLAENAKVIELEDELPSACTEVLFPSIAETTVVEGGIVSIVQVNVAGDGSLFVELSSDNTLNVWVPSSKLTEVNWIGLVQIVKLELSKLHSK